METSKVNKTMFPSAWQEKGVRALLWGGVALIGVKVINAVGPSVQSALSYLLNSTITFAGWLAIATALVVGGYAFIKLIPAIRTWIDTLSYKAVVAAVKKYPIIQAQLYQEEVENDIKQDRKAKQQLEGLKTESEKRSEGLQDEIDEHKDAVESGLLDSEARETSIAEVAALMEEQKPYQEIVKDITPMITTAADFIVMQERLAKQIARDIRVLTARFEAAGIMDTVVDTFNERFSGRSLRRRNYELARDEVFRKYSRTTGAVRDMREQLNVMVAAVAMKDQVKIAAARKRFQDSMQVIEIPAEEVEVLDSPFAQANRQLPNKQASLLRLDK